MWKRNAFPAIVAATLLSGQAHAAAPAGDRATCDGLPRLQVSTAPGFCLGLVASGMRAPRGLQVLGNGDIVVTDMGGWQAGRGRVWLIRNIAGRYEKAVLFDHLDRPSSVAVAPNGSVFVGMVKRVVRFDPSSPRPTLTDVIGGASLVPALPGSGRHLLPSLLFDPFGNLFVNVGSGSDHCEDEDGRMHGDVRCVEREGSAARAMIRKYTLQWPAGTVQGWAVYARGLRNSMAMAFDRTGSLWQGENGRDAINAAMPGLSNDDELPHDELNLVERAADYGWPYCYDENRSSPEYPKANCSVYRAPRRLLPAHAAPLGMTFYAGSAYPRAYNGSLVITYHGYRKHGHRLVALLPDRSGAPFGKSVDLVLGSREKGRGFGAPVGVSLGKDEKLYLTDDHDGIVARLSYEGAPD
jgi:glucose/arabinose dehydrogenase